MTQIPGPATDPSPYAGPAAGQPSGLNRFFDWLRSLDLRRDTDDKWLAGVCSGTANRLGVDPMVVRAGLVVLVLLGGLGITVYLVAWAFLPDLRDDIFAERAVRHGDVGGIILLVLALLSLLGGTGFAGDDNGLLWLWWVAVPVALVVWLVRRRRHDGAGHVVGSGYAAQAPYAGQHPYAAQAASASMTSTATSTSSATVPPQAYDPAAGQAPLPPQPPQAPPRAPRVPRPPRPPRRRGAGFVGALLVGGLALAAYGLTLWLHDAGNWAGSDEVVALAVALAVFGLGLLAFGLAGRRAGLTGFLAIILALTTWSASVVPNLNVGGGLGDRVWRPSATDSTGRYRLGIGQAELDLTRLPDNPSTARAIDAGVGIGELRVRIPANLTVEVRSSVGAGDISRAGRPELPPLPGGDIFDGTSDTTSRDSTDISTTETFGEGSPDVVVTAHVGLGQILIGKE